MAGVRGAAVLEPEWYKSREGAGILASLTNPATGYRWTFSRHKSDFLVLQIRFSQIGKSDFPH
jgi:hypothetical protein